MLPLIDELLMQYLLFRAFTKALSVECKRDCANGLDVEQIISQ